METLRDLDVVRAVNLRTELRAAPTDDDDEAVEGMPVMVVRFSVYNSWYEIDSWFEGQFLERTARGAFSRTINNSRDQVKVLFNHGMDFQIGDKVLGSINDLREDPDAAVGEVAMLDTSYNRDLIPGLRAGVYGSSFMFRVVQDEWNDDPGISAHNPKGIPERTIKEVRLFEFGPVTWPASPAATAGIRSLTDEYYERLRSREPQRYDDLRARVRNLRTPDPEPAASTPAAEPAPSTSAEDPAARTSDEGPADPAVIDPAPSHSNGLTPSQRAARIRAMRYPFLERKAS